MPDTRLEFGPPVLLTQTHETTPFNSGESVLDDWLRRRAWNNMQSSASRTYVLCPADSLQIIAYYALRMGQILAQDVVGSMHPNMPSAIPAIILGRFAFDQTWQGKGLGHAMLADAIRRSLRAPAEISAQLIIVHAISPAAKAFYLHHGFSRLPVEAPRSPLISSNFRSSSPDVVRRATRRQTVFLLIVEDAG